MVKIRKTNIASTISYMRKVWNEIAPDKPFDYSFLDQDLQKQYGLEYREGKIVTASSLFAILIACLGLFGLATLSAASRTKEIGIRKVVGASVKEIVGLISGGFLKLVLMSNVIAWPIAWYAANKWLQSFAYRINLGVWPFVLAGVLVSLIALLTVSSQAIKAARANPVESLRYE